MAHSTYPVDAELSTFLEGGGIDVSVLQSLFPDAIDAAISAFNDAIGYSFLAGEATTRYFTPPSQGGTLFIPYLASEPATITYTPSGGSAETLTLNTDYWLYPENAQDEGRPFEWVEFNLQWYGPTHGLRRALAITGRWGYATEVPDSVWQALLARAAYSLFAQLRQGVTSGRVSEKEGDVAVEYGTENWLQLLLPWVGKPEQNGMGGVYGQAVARYRKLGF